MNQEKSEQNKVDGTKKGGESTGKVTHITSCARILYGL